MNRKLMSLTLATAIAALAGCAETGPYYGSTYGSNPPDYGDRYSQDRYSQDRYARDRHGEDRHGYDQARRPVEYTGRVAEVETVQVQQGYRFGVGSVIGAVAGGLLGSQIGEGSGSTAAAIAGAAIGGAAGTAAESQLHRENATRVTVDLRGGGRATIVQPYDPRIERGMRVDIFGTGESARVVPAG